MEAISKIVIYLTLGVALLACNVWFVRAVYHSITGGDVVVAPVKVIGGAGDANVTGETLARMIISKLQSLEWDLRQSQSALRPEEPAGTKKTAKKTETKKAEAKKTETNKTETKKTDAKKTEAMAPPPAKPVGVTAGILGTPKTAGLNAQLFEPTNIDVKVAGVDVGGWLPRIQRWFVADRTLSFSVSWEGTTATVAGSIDALGLGKTRPVWITLEKANANTIADAIALALIHRRWAKDSAEFAELEDAEFGKLVGAINDVARINRRVTIYKASAKTDFEKILPSVDPLVDRITGWHELTYFVASIAEAAEKPDRALKLYRNMRGAEKSPLTADDLAEKISELEGTALTPTGDTKQTALQKLTKSVADATAELNKLFAASLEAPELELLSDDVLNSYFDPRLKKVFAPATVQDIPDIVYHEAAWPFIQSKWRFRYDGQPGALAQSYTDVLASLVKQAVNKQNAKTADWTIAPGAIAWITNKPNDIPTDRRPLRTLKAPGTAYDDPNIGKDPQVDHISKLVKGSADNGGIHANGGIANKAFYEAAMKIGSEKAGRNLDCEPSKIHRNDRPAQRRANDPEDGGRIVWRRQRGSERRQGRVG